MVTHLRVILWSLGVLWDLKGIVWPLDRFRLWQKSVRLYLSFLAFTDKTRPEEQLHRAMACALLSAVYDYDSDWTQGKRDGRNFFVLLLRYVRSGPARALASRLFSDDVAQDLSEDKLERGSRAMRFYQLVIDSQWMRGYSPEDIASFGRKLQIVDDLFDLDTDYLTYDSNCLLLNDRAQEFADEARQFLESEFFGRLKDNSRVYRVIDKTARKVLNRFGGPQARFAQLFAAGRPMTAGLFGLVLPMASLSFFEGSSWGLRLATGFCFMGLTMSIMVFNDWKDRYHDRKKGKLFASEHPKELWSYWMRLNAVTGGFLLLVAWYDPWTAAFCLLVWSVGLFYSFVPHWYMVQNLIVALCASAPALCGAVWAREWNAESTVTFLLFAVLLFLGEIYKDIEDARIDQGYKATLPVRAGHTPTVAILIGLVFIPAALMILHPNPWVARVPMVGMPVVMFYQGLMLIHRPQVAVTKRVMKWVMTALVLVLLIT